MGGVGGGMDENVEMSLRFIHPWGSTRFEVCRGGRCLLGWSAGVLSL